MKLLSFLIPFLVLSSCFKATNEKKEQNSFSDQKYSLIPEDTISIEIDSTTSNFYPDFQYMEVNSRRVLAIYNDNAHRLQLYDLREKNDFLNIVLKKEGTDAIPQLLGFHLHSLDSIFLFTLNRNDLILSDSLGQIKNKFEMSDKLDREIGYESSVDDYFDPSYESKTNLLTFWISPLIDNEISEYYQFPLAVDYNIKEKRIVKNYGYFPDFFRKENFYFLRNNLQRLLTPEFDIHYFDASHTLYLYDPNSKELIRTVYAKSQYLPDRIESATRKGEDPLPLQKQRNYNITNGRYDRLLYDKKNKLFFRFVRHPQELLAPDGLMNGKLTNNLSVLILDHEFGIAGEQLLPANVFMDDFCFVSDGKLWVNINHPDSKLNKEQYLQFITFKLQQQ